MRAAWILVGAGLAALLVSHPGAAQPAPAVTLDSVIARAVAYVAGYEQAFSVLVAHEHYVQEIRRQINPGTNLSRANPGGGMQGGDVVRRQVLRSDYLLVQLGPGAGWMPFRDVFEVNAAAVRDREDRLASLFLGNDADRFDRADRIMADSTRHNIGSVTRTINIPTLALMFLHPRVRERFTFELERDEVVDGVRLQRLAYRETSRPTLIKTTRGRDLALTGTLWLDPETGAIRRSLLTAADPAVRATVVVTFTPDTVGGIWIPAQMDEHYSEGASSNEIFATATYTNVRRFKVETDQKIGKPPGVR